MPACQPYPIISGPAIAWLTPLRALAWILAWQLLSTGSANAMGNTVSIGYLVLSPLSEPPSPERQAFVQRLGELGYRDGDNLTIHYRSAQWDQTRLIGHALDLVNLNVDLIVAVSPPAAIAARRITHTTPILFAPAATPTLSGLLDHIGTTSNNLTGISLNARALDAKRLDLLKEAYPAIRTVAILSGTRRLGVDPRKESAQAAAAKLGLQLEFYPVDQPQALHRAFAAMEQSPPDAILTFGNSRTLSYRRLIADFGRDHHIPTIAGLRAFADVGGVMSYGPSLTTLFDVLADYAAKLLDGSRVDELPLYQPRQYQLLINLHSARELGRPITSGVLFRADEVVE